MNPDSSAADGQCPRFGVVLGEYTVFVLVGFECSRVDLLEGDPSRLASVEF